VYTVVHLGTSS